MNIGKSAFVGIVGDNAQGVAIGHGAHASAANEVADAELIATVVTALHAAGRTTDAKSLQVVMEQAGPHHPATKAIGKTIWKEAKGVLTATLPPAMAAAFKALIGV